MKKRDDIILAAKQKVLDKGCILTDKNIYAALADTIIQKDKEIAKLTK